MIRVSGIAQDSIVDGPGLRFTLFTQGCPHACPGCHNPKTHPMEGGTLHTVESLAKRILSNPLHQGLTLSGGEPFVQAEACAELARQVRSQGKNIWVYSGYTYEQLRAAQDPAFDALLQACDVLIDGPYQRAQRSLGLSFRGSRNQRLIDLPQTLATGTIQLWQPMDSQAWVNVATG